MRRRSVAQRVAAVAALAEPVRRALFDLVSRSEQPVSRDSAAEALGLSRSTAAFHLDRLAGEGLLNVEYRRLGERRGPGAGRPAKLYRRSAAEMAVTIPPRRYDLAADLLAGAVDESIRTGAPVREVLAQRAYAAGCDIAATAGSIRQALEDEGFEPRDDGAGGLVLGNCPFHAVAQRYTALVCGLNLHLIRGVAAATGAPEDVAVLDPGPGRCCVRVAPAG